MDGQVDDFPDSRQREPRSESSTRLDLAVFLAGCALVGVAFEITEIWWVTLVAVALWLPVLLLVDLPSSAGGRRHKARAVGARFVGFGSMLLLVNLILAAVR